MSIDKSKDLQRIARIGANISREFTSPLSIIVSTLEAFERNETDEIKRLQLKVALRNAYKFRALTDDVFTLARLISADILYIMVKVDVVSLLQNIINSFQTAAKEKNVILEFKSPNEAIECYMDMQKLYRIIYRLLANGIRFMKSEGGIVRLSVFYLKEHNKLQIEIWDNGIGIIPEKVPHVFDLFYEKDPIHMMYYQGTGIGLNLVKYLSESLNGKITVESEKFSFTRFTVSLPVYKKKSEIPFEHVEIVDDVNYDQVLLLEEVMEVDMDEILQVRLPKEKANLIIALVDEEYQEYWNKIWPVKNELLLVNNIDAALGRILQSVPDLIVIQCPFNNASVQEAITFLGKNEAVSHVPIVIFAPNVDDAKQVELECRADSIILANTTVVAANSLLTNILENTKRIYHAAYQEAIKEFKQSKALSMEESFLAKVNGLLDKHMTNENFTVEQLSEEMFMSRTQIHRKLRAITNMSTTQYVKHYKLELALKELKAHTGTVSQIAYKHGFTSPAYFSRVFQEIYGMKPSDITRNE